MPQSLNGRFSAGVHPWDAANASLPEALDYLRRAPLAAIGEIGLDQAANVDAGVQMEVFKAQLEVAGERSLPVVIHCVRAYNETLGALKGYRLPAVIFHGYIGSPQQTARILKAGYCLSFGVGSLRSPKTVLSLIAAPVERIFAETDDSQEDIGRVYAGISEAVGMGVEELKRAVYNNFKRIFG